MQCSLSPLFASVLHYRLIWFLWSTSLASDIYGFTLQINLRWHMSLSLASFFFLNYVDHVHNRKQQHLFLSPLVCLFVFFNQICCHVDKHNNIWQKKLPFSEYDLARVLLADLSRTCSRNKKNYVHHVLCNMLMSCNWSIYGNGFFAGICAPG